MGRGRGGGLSALPIRGLAMRIWQPRIAIAGTDKGAETHAQGETRNRNESALVLYVRRVRRKTARRCKFNDAGQV